MQVLNVIKIGGNIIDDPEKCADFLQQFAALPGAKILVHGGGKIATEIGEKLGIEAHYIGGRRVTDAPTLELVTMVYGGLINKNITARLQALNCKAIGLTGADGNIIAAKKRPVKDIDYGHVGDVNANGVNASLLSTLLNAGLVPVLAPLTHDSEGHLLNTNADTIAQEVAKALAATHHVQLIYCFEKAGVLTDPNDDTSVIHSIHEDQFRQLVQEGTISGGMIPKLENAFAAIHKGVTQVIICCADDLPALIHYSSGTHIQ